MSEDSDLQTVLVLVVQALHGDQVVLGDQDLPIMSYNTYAVAISVTIDRTLGPFLPGSPGIPGGPLIPYAHTQVTEHQMMQRQESR